MEKIDDYQLRLTVKKDKMKKFAIEVNIEEL